ncbi:MAG: T9SS type A sorting domain-containing protein [Chitinophagales bacterium]|nr:T9SS type A sorting domain-containing protein [Chitinophagales bacterium]
MKKLFFILSLFIITRSFAQSPTWNDDVANIVFDNCGTCHRDGGIAPFSLLSYELAYDERYDVADAVEEKEMPPWLPDPNYRHFKDEKVLSEEEINTIIEWVNNGAPKGSGLQPEAPEYADGPYMEDIDQIVELPAYTVQEEDDEYRTFVIHSGLTETKYISEIEFIPGNASAVHHILFWQDTSNISWELDAEDPLPGYKSNGAMTGSEFTKLISGWAPGAKGTYKLPAGMGIEVSAGADFVVEIHFAPGSKDKIDQSSINLKYSDAFFTRPVWVDPILFHFPPVFQEPEFFIPANEIVTFHEIFPDIAEFFGVDLTFITLSPHMHLIGETFEAYSVSPANDTTKLIYIPHWDFHWQNAFTFQKLQRIPVSSDVYGIATYNNTSSNEHNPNDPPEDVWLGEETTDEMMLCFFAYTFYLPGDENVILDSSIIITDGIIPDELTSVNIFPNPAADVLHILVSDVGSDHYDMKVYNVFGNIVFSETVYNRSVHEINIEKWSTGMYVVDISAGGKRKTFKVMKAKE